MICSLLGCGLILDLDPPEETRPDVGRADVGRPDVGRPDVGRADASLEDARPPDIGRADGGESDGLVVMPDVPDVVEVPDALTDVGRTCATEGDCGENRPCHAWACEMNRCVENVQVDGVSCEADGLFCTQGSCSGGICDDSAMTLCPSDDCNAPRCNEDADRCEREPINDGDSCDALNGVAFCADGDCHVDRCISGFGDCVVDGLCDTNLLTDPGNCGGCGSACAEGRCMDGSCP